MALAGWLGLMLISVAVGHAAAAPASTHVEVRVTVGAASSVVDTDLPLDADTAFAQAFYLTMTGGLDVFGVAEVLSQGKHDPFLASLFRIENRTDQTQFVSAFISATVQPIGSGQSGALERRLQVSVLDGDRGGTPSYGRSGQDLASYTFLLDDTSTGLGVGRGDVFSVGAGSTTLLDGTEPPFGFLVPPVLGQLDRLSFSMSGYLSARDTVEIEFFSCLRAGGQTCPSAPTLRGNAVPTPPGVALLAIGVSLWILGIGRRRGTGHRR